MSLCQVTLHMPCLDGCGSKFCAGTQGEWLGVQRPSGHTSPGMTDGRPTAFPEGSLLRQMAEYELFRVESCTVSSAGRDQMPALAVRWPMPSVCGGVRCAVDGSCAKLCTAPYSFGCGSEFCVGTQGEGLEVQSPSGHASPGMIGGRLPAFPGAVCCGGLLNMSCFTLNRALCRVLGKGQQAALAVRWLMPSVCGGVRCAVDGSCAKLCTAP